VVAAALVLLINNASLRRERDLCWVECDSLHALVIRYEREYKTLLQSYQRQIKADAVTRGMMEGAP